MGETGLSVSDDRIRLAHLIARTAQHEVLIRLIRENGWKLGAEIGVLKGKTLFALLENVPDLKMFAVDQWKHLPLRPDTNAETYSHVNMASHYQKVRSRALRYGERVKILHGDSVEMAKRVADASLDFVFIDADHTEWGVNRDICAWAPKVRSGGMVLGHDINWETVRHVVDRHFPGRQDFGENVWGAKVA